MQPLLFIIALVVLAFLRQVLVRAAARAAMSHLSLGNWSQSAVWFKWLRRFGATLAEAELKKDMGDMEGAVASARLLLKDRRFPAWHRSNSAVNVLTCAGLYGEAVEVGDAFFDGGFDKSTPRARAEAALVKINLAEALYNLGRWDEAWNALEGVDAYAAESPVPRAGLLIQRAWILAHTGKAEQAMALLDATTDTDIPLSYQSETKYCRAATFIALGRFDEAAKAIDDGMCLAKRAQSPRHGLFMKGHLCVAQNQLEAACDWFREGSELPYKRQGGDGLLAWGDALAKLGRREEAVHAWRLAVERDGESVYAASARERLAAGE